MTPSSAIAKKRHLRPVWWRTKHRRFLSPEIMYLLTMGPLVIRPEVRFFAIEVWRKNLWSPKAWPTQYQWARLFGVSERAIGRWVQDLEAAQMLRFDRPYNIRDGRGGWKGPRKEQGSYKLLPPSAWKYRDGWIYLGEREGWVTKDNEIVLYPPDVFSFPKYEPRQQESTESA